MKKFDPNGDDPGAWTESFGEWKAELAEAKEAQKAALAAANTAAATLSALTTWRDQLATRAAEMTAREGAYGAVRSALKAMTLALDDLDGRLQDHAEARDVATAKLVRGPATDHPVILLPVRIHTTWRARTLWIRILPSELHIDRHEPRLNPIEIALSRAYWKTHSVGGTDQEAQAWADLTRRVTAQRAAWIVRNTSADGAVVPLERDAGLDTSVTVRLLPDRFAVVLLSQGEPVDVAAPGHPATFTSWGRVVPAELPVTLLYPADKKPWTVDIDAAVDVGMGLHIEVPAGAPAIDELVVVGMRANSTPADLATLLEHHLYSSGADLLSEGTATNNSAADRTARTTPRDREALYALVSEPDQDTCPQGSAGQQLADLLAIPTATAALLPGALTDRTTSSDALELLMAAVTSGTLTATLPRPSPALASLAPSGPGPTLRVGKQPFGILPTLEAGRWIPGPDPIDQTLGATVHQVAAGQTLPLDVDPLRPPPRRIPPRRVTHVDDSALTDVLAEHPSTVAWTAASQRWSDLDQLVGTADGPGSPAEYLAQLATGASTAEVNEAAAKSVLGGLALTAASTAGASAAFATLASAAAADNGRPVLARLLADHLDVRSHRVDAWVTAAAARRRAEQQANPPAVGAYGYLTDVAPRGTPRSFGHIHAPSPAHAATAAVLRSGYLGQRRTAWAAQLGAAIKVGDLTAAATAREGLATLAPLNASVEDRLPLAIDLSSGRVRTARWILSAVRQGQALGAVLGQQLERDLANNGLQHCLAPLRKLTRFPTGTVLEGLVATRDQRGADVAADLQELTRLNNVAAAKVEPLAAAQRKMDQAQVALKAAQAAQAPYDALAGERAEVLKQYTAAAAQHTQKQTDQPTTKTRTVQVSVP